MNLNELIKKYWWVIIGLIAVWYFFIPHGCGGFTGQKCPIGYTCEYQSHTELGRCVLNTLSTCECPSNYEFTCDIDKFIKFRFNYPLGTCGCVLKEGMPYPECGSPAWSCEEALYKPLEAMCR